MKTHIFKSERKAKCYEIRASKKFHIYSAGELINKVKTDKIELFTEKYQKDEITITEIK